MTQFIVSSIALVLIFITMLGRANDLRWRKGWVWNLRLIGFICAGFAPIGIIGSEFVTGVYPSVYETFFRVGLAMVFLTTPHLPPWWRWISGLHKDEPMLRRRDDL